MGLVKRLLVLIVAFSSIQNAIGQEDQKILDSLSGKIAYHLNREQIDSALGVTKLLYETHLRLGNRQEVVRSKIHRAEILRTINSLDLAFESLKEVEDINKSLEPSTVKSFYFNRLAAIQFERKNPQAAITAVKKSQAIDSLKNYKWRIFSNFNILGAIYRDLEQWDEAVQILRSTYEKAKELGDTAELNSSIRNLSMALYRMGDYRGAVFYGNKYSETPWLFSDYKSISDNFRIVAAAYQKLGIYDSAYFALDSAHKHILDGMQTMVEKRTDNYRVANELEKQKLENSILLSEKENSQLQSILLIIVLISILVIALVLFRQKQGYKKLNAKKEELNLKLESSLHFKNQLIGIVAHDIRNPMSSLTGVLHLYNEGLINNKDLKDMMANLEASATSVNFLIENLLNWVLSQKEALIANCQDFNLDELIEKTVRELEVQFKTKGLILKVIGLEPSIQINSDEAMLGLVIRNILSNAIKFSPKDSNIIISYQQEELAHRINIKDFGVGMDKEVLSSLTKGDTSSREGTTNEKGTGLGLQLSRDFLKAIGASYEISSEKGKGTEVSLIIPFPK